MAEMMTERAKPIPSDIVGRPAIELFRLGYDTLDIAAAKNVGEHIVLKWLNNARMAEVVAKHSEQELTV